MWRFALLFLLCSSLMHATETTPNVSTNRSLSDLEKKFRDTLANCILNGRWCLIENGKMTEEYEEKYTIQGATKSGNDVWLIYARIQYAGKDLTVPVPIQLKWAGDTPVMVLDKVSIPGLGTYSARVLIYDRTYAGTWSAPGHGGMLHGVIEKTAVTSKENHSKK